MYCKMANNLQPQQTMLTTRHYYNGYTTSLEYRRLYILANKGHSIYNGRLKDIDI